MDGVKSLLLSPCLLCCAPWAEAVDSSSDEQIVPIDNEPSHRAVLHGVSMRVFDAFFPSGKVSLYHSHKADSVFVCLEGADVASEEPGKAVTPRPPIPSGHIYYRPYAQQPLVHRVRNLSPTSFRILDIEVLKERPTVPVVLPELPSAFSVVIDNDRVRVAKLHLVAGQSTIEIEFAGPRLLAVLNAGRFAISFRGQPNRRSVDAIPGSLDMQENVSKEVIINAGDTDLDLVSIEIK
ncbi:MAG TPA: hypothetical protein VM532_09540 [Burkholderiales bacterium]|nr:hypothetical protein [Burkholderiales bacterium]